MIDDLINIAREAVIARNQFMEIFKYEDDSEEDIRINRLNQLITVFYNKLMKMRLLKIDSIFPRLQRVVRDISKQLDKEVKLVLLGKEIEIDEVVMEGITESLLHIIRNSIDHGIEKKEERISLGKPTYGTITFQASLQKGNVYISISDDGKGIDEEKVKQKAIQEKLVSIEEANKLSREKILELIFHPGLSTSDSVSSISGRGVGMDVVKTNFKKFDGQILIESTPNVGTKITGIIPQTLSVLPAFIIGVQNKKFAIIQKYVVELVQYLPENILSTDTTGSENLSFHKQQLKILKHREKRLPLIDLGNMLFPNLENECVDTQPSNSSKNKTSQQIAIIRLDNQMFALSFDSLISVEEIVLKPLAKQINHFEIFGGFTLSGDGSVILVLEPISILKYLNLKIEQNVENLTEKKLYVDKRNNYLFFKISGESFFIPAKYIINVRKITEQDIRVSLNQEIVDIEDEIISIIQLESYLDITKKNTNHLYCIELKNTDYPMGLIVSEILDINYDVYIRKNEGTYNSYILGYTKLENELSLLINLEKILGSFNENFQDGRKEL